MHEAALAGSTSDYAKQLSASPRTAGRLPGPMTEAEADARFDANGIYEVDTRIGGDDLRHEVAGRPGTFRLRTSPPTAPQTLTRGAPGAPSSDRALPQTYCACVTSWQLGAGAGLWVISSTSQPK